ncbi:MAG: acyl-CoA dehydrogenase family protein [Gammaproteobacteria bacterium]|nr:acyl-CoA dehydrogenase family protein [Gammaproteobacteria bacterium]
MNETQQMLEDSVNRLFGDRLGWDQLTAIEEHGFPTALWQEAVEQGITKVLASEAAGGMGVGWYDAYPVLRAAGRHAVPLPVAEAAIAEWLAGQAGVELPEGVPGLLPATLGPAQLTAAGLRLDSVRTPWGRNADYLVGVAETGTGAELVVASPKGLAIASEDNIGRDPRDSLTGTAALIARQALPQPADSVRWLGALARSAQIAGAGAAALDLALKYSSERSQFGKPLSGFQAIQHYLADLAGLVASVDAITMAACAGLDQRGMAPSGRNARFEIAAAKCRASEAVEKLTRLSHQCHGAIGFTYEYGLHFLTRRLWAWRAEFGGAGEWGEYLGRIAAEVGGDGIWPAITA